MSLSSDQGGSVVSVLSRQGDVKPSIEKELTAILLDAENLLTKLKGRHVTYPTLLYTPGQLAAMSQQEIQDCQHGWMKPYNTAPGSASNGLYDGSEAAGKTFLANAGLDMSKIENQFKQYTVSALQSQPQNGNIVATKENIAIGSGSIQTTDDFFEKKWQHKIAACLDKIKFEVSLQIFFEFASIIA
jgi:hypothetical protein